MKKNHKIRNRSFWAIIGVFGALILYSCSSSNTTTIRIKTDPDRSIKDKSVSEGSEKPLNQAVLQISSTPKQTKEELLGERVNQLLSHYVRAEELMAEGKVLEAEDQLIRASAIVESREGLLVLLKIYEQSGNQVKADSCRKRLATLGPVILSENYPG